MISTDPTGNHPVTGDLTLAYISSLIIALLMAGVSIAGLLLKSDIYPSQELTHNFVANDVVNLVIGVPILLGSIWFAHRGKLIGLLLWPGALFFVVYNHVPYVFAMPLNWAFLLHLGLLVLSLYTMIGLVARFDGKVVQQQLSGNVPELMSGGVLFGFGTLFLLRTIGELVNPIVSQASLPINELALLVADFMIIPAWVIGGLLLLRRMAQGYVVGMGLLFHGSMLFIGLIMFIILAPILTGAPFILSDLLVISIFSLFFFIPFALFVREVISVQ